MIQSGGFQALPDRHGACGVSPGQLVSSGGSEGLGLSGLGSMDTFVSRPAVGASSPFMESVTLSNG